MVTTALHAILNWVPGTISSSQGNFRVLLRNLVPEVCVLWCTATKCGPQQATKLKTGDYSLHVPLLASIIATTIEGEEREKNNIIETHLTNEFYQRFVKS